MQLLRVKLVMTDCFVCDRIALIKENKNKYFVKELKSGYVVLGDYQYFRGYTIFISKVHTDELHKLTPEIRKIFLEEMAIVAEAVYKAFKPKKLNYEIEGNSDHHLHWHLFPRYGTDPHSETATWVVDKAIRASEATMPNNKQLNILKTELLKELNKLI